MPLLASFFSQSNSHSPRASYLSKIQELDGEARIKLGSSVDVVFGLSDVGVPV